MAQPGTTNALTRSDQIEDGTSGTVLVNTNQADPIMEGGRHLTSADFHRMQDEAMQTAPPQQNTPDREPPVEETGHADVDPGTAEVEGEGGDGSSDGVSGVDEEVEDSVKSEDEDQDSDTQPTVQPPPAPATAQAGAAAPTVAPGPAPPLPAGPTYTSADVDRLETWYTFTHRVHGIWVHGPPRQGAPPQTAVRGPDAPIWKAGNVGRNRQ